MPPLFGSSVLYLSCTICSCFERFFKAVNSKEGRIVARRRSGYMMDDLDLIGLEYLWRVNIVSRLVFVVSIDSWCSKEDHFQPLIIPVLPQVMLITRHVVMITRMSDS